MLFAVAKQVHLLGVRHHGPGSARAVLRALDALAPQCVLIEGPPDAESVLQFAASEAMRPPIALLIYQSDDPQQAAFYPFAEFSPEWCAIRWALARQVPVRFMDLPQSHRFAIVRGADEADASEPADETASKPPAIAADEPAPPEAEPDALCVDPLRALAVAAGFDDGERWWEHMFEHRRADQDVFTAISEAMHALREEQRPPGVISPLRADEPYREAWMRKTIREAGRSHESLAVVCGAWHVPALTCEVIEKSKKDDDSLLKSLSKVKTTATWIPWTYGRLAAASGYGAGVQSPGWYEHLWRHPTHVLERWMMRIARLLREKDLDCSSAHVIEATRLATSLAAMRSRPLADLSDIADACRAVFCFDSDLAMRLIADKLLVGERLGEVPEETPVVPLQQDLERLQKRLRLKPEAMDRMLDLDLRKEIDLGRSELLHRLRLLDVHWGTPAPTRGGKGTFHELWELRWEPGFVVRLIERGVWGNTVESAAVGFVGHRAAQAHDLQQLTDLLDDLVLANLPAAVAMLTKRILAAAAVSADVANLMDALPPLARAYHYGNVRQTDKGLFRQAIDGVLPRILIGLAGAVASLGEDAAREMERRILQVDDAVQLLESADESDAWLNCLANIAGQANVHGMLGGRCTRLLFDQRRLTMGDVAARLSLMLSRGGDPAQAAAWVEGFLSASGLTLLHHDELLRVIDDWICSIPAEVFNEQVPLLRRTFSTFAPAERRQIGERLVEVAVPGPTIAVNAAVNLNAARAAKVLPVLRAIFGTTPAEIAS